MRVPPGVPPRLVPVSDAPHRPQPEESASAEELDRIALPATLRAAPRFSAFVLSGGLGGFVVGFLLGALLPNSTGAGRGTVGLFIGLGIGVLGALAGGLIAVWLDRDTPRHLKATRAADATTASAPQNEEDR